jgi:hypothetical protein
MHPPLHPFLMQLLIDDRLEELYRAAGHSRQRRASRRSRRSERN